jgi:hypothetical protein
MRLLLKKNNLNRRKRRLEKGKQKLNSPLQKEKQPKPKSQPSILRTLHGPQLMVVLRIYLNYSYRADLIAKQLIMRLNSNKNLVDVLRTRAFLRLLMHLLLES